MIVASELLRGSNLRDSGVTDTNRFLTSILQLNVAVSTYNLPPFVSLQTKRVLHT